MSTASKAARQPKRYSTQKQTETEALNAPRFVFTAFRTLDVSKMRICTTRVNRCEVTLIESFPHVSPNLGEFIDVNRKVYEEKMIPAALQAETLVYAFGIEGLKILEGVTPDNVDEIADLVDVTSEMNFADAILHINAQDIPLTVKSQIIASISVATQHARNVLNDTKREIQSARAGKRGKDYLDDRDLNACKLLGIPEASIMSLEGAASNQTLEALATKITDALKPQSSGLSPEIEAMLQEQSATLKRLTSELEALKKQKTK